MLIFKRDRGINSASYAVHILQTSKESFGYNVSSADQIRMNKRL